MINEMILPKEMIDRYVERRKVDLLTVENAIKSDDFETLKNVGHQIKGNAATFSFKDLEAIGISLEVSGLCADPGLARITTSAFRDWVQAQG